MTTDEDTTASAVTVSYRPATERVRQELQTPSYRGYLRKAQRGRVAVGDEWSEFVSCGCGTTEDVELRVERIEGGSAIGTETAFEFVSRTEPRA
ncbi:hypothetical protein [Natronoglomus mannanivorans]|uniref:DUF7968 domain-containing protein n=1 Tax=Natronoglomus mannanivorans TaxID=2979990 RepID=A0AAP3DZV3_9EURY|nr:hypothetical protein [Halobacteria archaeon AArc-xg1-1]